MNKKALSKTEGLEEECPANKLDATRDTAAYVIGFQDGVEGERKRSTAFLDAALAKIAKLEVALHNQGKA